jgi:RimJ/RimL family protein N-acetyltransferase
LWEGNLSAAADPVAVTFDYLQLLSVTCGYFAVMLASPRLLLRHLSPDDAEFILGLLNEPSFLRFVGDKGVRTLDDAREYILKGPMESYRRRGFGLSLVSLKETGTPIGICGLVKRDGLENVDIGFAFLPAYWSRGYAFEAASAVMAQARNTFGIDRFLAIVSPDNYGSIRVVEKLGLTFERMWRPDGEESEVKLFSNKVTESK